MDLVPEPLRSLLAGPGPAGEAGDAGAPAATSGARVQVGGRHGSPTVVLGLPFAGVRVVEGSPVLADELVALAAVVADLAVVTEQLAAEASPALAPASAAVATAAAELRDRIVELVPDPG